MVAREEVEWVALRSLARLRCHPPSPWKPFHRDRERAEPLIIIIITLRDGGTKKLLLLLSIFHPCCTAHLLSEQDRLRLTGQDDLGPPYFRCAPRHILV